MTPRLADLPARDLGGGLRVATASSYLPRLRGLTGLAGLDHDEGLEIPRCRSVHTIGMRFPLDLVWLDEDGRRRARRPRRAPVPAAVVPRGAVGDRGRRRPRRRVRGRAAARRPPVAPPGW